MVGATSLGLPGADLPAVCRSASDASLDGQRRTELLVRVERPALIVAGAAGSQSLRVGPSQPDASAGVAGLLFLVSPGAIARHVRPGNGR